MPKNLYEAIQKAIAEINQHPDRKLLRLRLEHEEILIVEKTISTFLEKESDGIAPPRIS